MVLPHQMNSRELVSTFDDAIEWPDSQINNKQILPQRATQSGNSPPHEIAQQQEVTHTLNMDPSDFGQLMTLIEKEQDSSKKMVLVVSATNSNWFSAFQIGMLLNEFPLKQASSNWSERIKALSFLAPRCIDLHVGDNAHLLLRFFPVHNDDRKQAILILFPESFLFSSENGRPLYKSDE